MATPPGAARPVTPPAAQPATRTVPPTAPPSIPPKPKALYDRLDARLLREAGTFTVLLRNGERWEKVKLLDMDTWSLLVQGDQGRVLYRSTRSTPTCWIPPSARYPLAWSCQASDGWSSGAISGP